MFHGSMVALVTPMHLDGALDTAALRRLVDFQIDNGTTAIVAVGTTGESPTLDMEEHCEVIRLAVEYARGRVPVTLQLLSPARRPIQVTQDLKGFWERTYAEVKKELKGRYPKHPWPDDPWNAVPTKKAKQRK